MASVMVGLSGCVEELPTVLGRLLDSRRLSAELLVQFARATEAGNRAVMADTAETAASAERDLAAAMSAVDRDTGALASELKELSYETESGLLTEFQKRLVEFRALDGEILQLTALDTNLKAQQLSFGPAKEAADAVRDALAALVAQSPRDSWQIRALAAEVMASVREIQALQAPHIAEADDVAMTRLEERIDRAQSSARQNLAALTKVSRPESKDSLAAASASVDQFVQVHAEILKLSRQNSNVRALALALGKRRTLAAVCEEHLRAVQEALAKREIGPRRSS
jgi:rhodanese-related sulfurtransferase